MSARKVPKTLRQKIGQRDGWQCVYCRASVRTIQSIKGGQFVNRDATRIFFRDRRGVVQSALYATIDHIVPVSAGGGKDEENLVLACAPCNSAKSCAPVHKFVSGNGVATNE